ncbi:DUF3316 domain-containing protein [uncultured Proteiniphilum sp.]|uniref:DUF3316 domain-containing protein n=1 Tax=uncultured Proteiniphilum sp. TaxID=497637 RepID=UPI002620A4B8|nr:DUF3316 domain-containing protein [uncultured Proteiniphilum sp.]
MKKTALLFSLWIGIFCVTVSQESRSPILPVSPVNQSTLFGIGKAFLNDSYLSPLRYSGISMSLMHDRIKGTPYFGGNLLLQQQFLIQTAITKNPTASASEYYGNIHYRLTGFYPLLATPNFRLFGGGGWEASLGGIYNVRNSNNPGSLKVSTNLHLSALAVYNWKIFTFRWQLATPFSGMFFSPEYGHSYYEIFTLGNNKGTVHFGSFHNQQALRSYFSVDMPVHNITLRAAYLGDYYNTHVNELTTRMISHQFMIGFAVESLNFGGRRVRSNPPFPSVYY